MEKNLNEHNKHTKISNYLSLLQLKYDCETLKSLIQLLQGNSITAWGLIPYISLTANSALDMFSVQIPTSLQIKDVRMKLKIFEDGYSKSKRVLLNIDYLQDQIFKNRLKFEFMKNWNIHKNLGIYTDENKNVVGNTQYYYYLLHDSRFLKKAFTEVAENYFFTPDKFDLNEQVGRDCYEYANTCGQIIGTVCTELKEFGGTISVSSKINSNNFFYGDYNTNNTSKISKLFPSGEEGKAIRLYLLHILSTLNFLLFVLNNCAIDDYGWWLKSNYITYYYTIRKLKDLQKYLIRNNLLTQEIKNYLEELELENAKYICGHFRNYLMHFNLTDKTGNFMINSDYLNFERPLLGLVETCFEGKDYNNLKLSVISEMKRISKILSKLLKTESLQIKPL